MTKSHHMQLNQQQSQKLFRNLLNEGFNRIKVSISLCVKDYLENLLIFYIPSDRLFDTHIESGKKHLKPLAEFYLKAQVVSNRAEKFYLLKQLGDRSLYLGGFFRESLNRKLVNANYYLNMGRNAYETLAQNQNQSSLFQELSECFVDLMDVLSYVYHKNSVRTDKDLLKVCENYLKTGSKSSSCQLEDHGFCIQKHQKSH